MDNFVYMKEIKVKEIYDSFNSRKLIFLIKFVHIKKSKKFLSLVFSNISKKQPKLIFDTSFLNFL